MTSFSLHAAQTRETILHISFFKPKNLTQEKEKAKGQKTLFAAFCSTDLKKGVTELHRRYKGIEDVQKDGTIQHEDSKWTGSFCLRKEAIEKKNCKDL